MSAHVTTFKAFLKAHETGLIQRTPAWIKARKHTIGASEMAVLTRASPFDTPASLVCKKLHPIDLSQNVACAWGRLFELFAREYIEWKHDTKVFGHTISLNLAKSHPLYGKVTCSPDGYFQALRRVYQIKMATQILATKGFCFGSFVAKSSQTRRVRACVRACACMCACVLACGMCACACLLACVCACMCACFLACVCACMCACFLACVLACGMCACLLACLHVCLLAACVHVCVLACVHVCLLACVHVCLCVCMCLLACLLACVCAYVLACGLRACMRLACMCACLLACLRVCICACMRLACLHAACLHAACLHVCLLACMCACVGCQKTKQNKNKKIRNPIYILPEHGGPTSNPCRDGTTRCQIHRKPPLAGEHPREQPGLGYRQRSIPARQPRPNTSRTDPWLSTILRRPVRLRSPAGEGCCAGWQPSVLHNRQDGCGLAGCWSHFQPFPGGLAASGAQVHPCVDRKNGGCGGGRQDLRNYPGNRGWVRWKTRARVASPTRWCRPYRLLCSQAGCVGAVHRCAARGFAAIPAAAVGELYGFVPARLHPRLVGNPRPPGAGAASRGGPPLLPPGRATPREPAGLHLGQHRFCRQPCMHLCANHRRAHNLHQVLQQVRLANRGGRRAGPVRRPHVGCGCQHQRPSPPDTSPPRRPGPRLHAGGDLHLRLLGGGAIPRQGRQYVGARPAVGNPRGRWRRHRPIRGAAAGQAVGELRKLSRSLLGSGRPFAGQHLCGVERQ